MNEPRTYLIGLVCTGNTCRSPMSEGILKALARELGMKHWRIESGGLSAMPGFPASPGSILAALEDGVDLSLHRSSVFTRSRAEACDLILVHSGEHYHRIATWSDALADKTFLIKHFPQPGDPGPEAWVEDPIGLDLSAYRETYRELKAELNRIVQGIRARAEEGAN